MTTPNPRLKWLCRRGMKELDILMENYLAARYPNDSPERQHAFETLLEYQDPAITDLLFDRTTDPNPEIQAIINMLKTAQLAANDEAKAQR